jgi:hypothetical protein
LVGITPVVGNSLSVALSKCFSAPRTSARWPMSSPESHEIVAVLVKAFPDREADGMRKTVLIQGVDQTPFDGAACDSTVGYFIYRTATLT